MLTQKCWQTVINLLMVVSWAVPAAHCAPGSMPDALPASVDHFQLEPNLGQWRTSARYCCRAGNVLAGFDEEGIRLQVCRPCEQGVVEWYGIRLSFDGRSSGGELA